MAGVLHEGPRDVPIVHECDLCVIGGSCTGVFAAVRAARLGARVAVVENNGFFGGVATAGLVNVWHSLRDTAKEIQIIGGLTAEVIERLVRRDAAIIAGDTPSRHVVLNSAELAIELDALVDECPAIRPFLHARFVAPLVEDGRVTHAIIEDKSGRRAIRAAYFIDASGDGDLLVRAGFPFNKYSAMQPPSTCAVFQGLDDVKRQTPGFDLGKAVFDPQRPNSLPSGFLWGAEVPGCPGLRMVAGTRVHGADCADADALTRAEMEGRRQVRAMRDIVRENFPGGEAFSLVAVPSHIGVRETRHAVCRHRLTEEEVLGGVRFPDAIANGSYRVDIHHADRGGLTFRYLDGTEECVVPGKPTERGRWREAREVNPTYYQVPYRSLIPEGAKNLLVAGRLIDADTGAFGASRVMVNCNQSGEAAGMACALALEHGIDVSDVDPAELRATLSEGGSVIL